MKIQVEVEVEQIAESIIKQLVETGRVVEVVRCKDCKFAVLTDDGEYCPEDMVCSYWESDGLTETDYCSYAERRHDAHTEA